MRAVVKSRPETGAELSEVEIPKIRENEILVRVRATSICGTDVHIYDWNKWASSHIKVPHILGHEFCGDVMETGSAVRSVNVGDFVSAETHIPCGACAMCRTGNMHICQNLKILGVDINGCFADYVAIPELCAWKTDKNLPLEIACVQEPLGNAVHVVLRESVSAKSVLVLGCGPAGLFSIAVARACGAGLIIATDISSDRLRLAKKVGADVVLNPSQDDIVSEVRRLTDSLGAECVFEMSGSQQALSQGLKAVRMAGHVILFGLPAEEVKINLNDEVIFKYIRLYGVTGRLIFQTWYTLAELLKSGKLDVRPVITHKLRLTDFRKGMELMKSGRSGKVVMFT